MACRRMALSLGGSLGVGLASGGSLKPRPRSLRVLGLPSGWKIRALDFLGSWMQGRPHQE